MFKKLLLLCGLLLASATANASTGIFIIGDSISLGYTPYIKDFYGTCVIHAPGNNHESGHIVANIDDWLAGKHYHIIHVNAGLWDIAHRLPGTLILGDVNTYPITTSLSDYTNNVSIILTKAQQHADIVIWASTTDVPDGSIGRVPEDVITYNSAATAVAKSMGLQVDSLYKVAIDNPGYHKFPASGNYVHFVDAGYQILANHINSVLFANGGCD